MKAPKAQGTLLPKLIIAAALVALLAALLGWARTGALGQSATKQESSAPPADAPSSAAPRASSHPRAVRSLIPSSAWLVVDFSTELTERGPFEDSTDEKCRRVLPPSRAAVGILPGRTDVDDPVVVLAGAAVSPDFFECARQRILAGGGAEAPLAPGLDLLKSHNGFLLHERKPGNLVFATGKPDVELLVRTLLGLSPGASASHAGDPSAEPTEDNLAYLTLELPPGWLNSVGDEANHSPLRFARGGTAELGTNGDLEATLDCVPEGCGELRRFAERALGDFVRSQGGGFGAAVEGAKWSEMPGKISLTLNGRRGLPAALRALLPGGLSRQ